MNIIKMSGPENGTFLGEQKVPFYDDIFVIFGARFFGSRRNFWARGGPKMTILAIFGHFQDFRGPPKIRIFRKKTKVV